jgi:hypothetical protein
LPEGILTEPATPGTQNAVSRLDRQPAGSAAATWIADMERLNASAVHLASTACHSSGWPNNTFGYGRLDALEMLNIAKGDINGMET